MYYKEAVGAIVVFDVTRIATFEAAAKWKSDIDSKVTVGVEEKPIPVILLANKVLISKIFLIFQIDMAKDGFVKSASQMDQYCKENNFVGWFVRMK